MSTPIFDFVQRYREQNPVRLHMPGHKGRDLLGAESVDITEIPGADSLYEAAGIIAESEKNASARFGCPTFYSTEGSSHCIRAMLHLACLDAKAKGKRPVVAAGRNAHKVFLSAAALLNFEIRWIYGSDAYLSCAVTPKILEQALRDGTVTAVYLTSPDYLGNTVDVAALSDVCRRYGALLLIDSAHGAYLKFLPHSLHPMDLGADLCCDSAHKTLPVLTGGAYLHVRKDLKPLINQAKSALALFGSTSPSYLILQSLDLANDACEKEFPQKLRVLIPQISALKQRLSTHGFDLVGDEPIKLTVAPKSYGYTGTTLAKRLEAEGIVCEFADPDFVVFMISPENTPDELQKLEESLLKLPRKEPISTLPPKSAPHEQAISVRHAALSPAEEIPAEESAGRILAASTVGCPPAVPVIACGEKITNEDLQAFSYYGIKTLWVSKEE
ncbi:MAG: aminotransferase class V-fold PLP-dependent enzyme [Clostridia bacterium]|nr:aminotransferase class V-fold PLP-dependent enzyme [Clostridia bacterium]